MHNLQRLTDVLKTERELALLSYNAAVGIKQERGLSPLAKILVDECADRLTSVDRIIDVVGDQVVGRRNLRDFQKGVGL